MALPKLTRKTFMKIVGCFATLGTFLFLFCLIGTFILVRQQKEATFAECSDKAKTDIGKAAPSDEKGILRIVATWPQEILVGQRLCIVVAGVAPAGADQPLRDDLETARLSADTRRAEYQKSMQAYATARQAAAEANSKADQAVKAGAPDAQALRTAASKAETDAADKDRQLGEASKNKKSADDAYNTALSAVTRGLPPVDLFAFLSSHRVTQPSLKARAIAEPQALLLGIAAPTDATGPAASFWRDLLGGGTSEGKKTIEVGLARTAADTPDVTAPAMVTLKVYDPLLFAAGVASSISLIISLILFASQSTLLRVAPTIVEPTDLPEHLPYLKAFYAAKPRLDALHGGNADSTVVNADPAVHPAWKALQLKWYLVGKPKACYSLGRTQMALWLVLVTIGFVFLWLTLGQYLNVINASILVLLGINGASGLLAQQLEKPGTLTAKSESFLEDILSDGNGPQLQRIQVVIWTVILALVFIWNVFTNFVFVVFDTNLLLLMGIAQATYIGFKQREAPVQ